jgi:hypothetical protein
LGLRVRGLGFCSGLRVRGLGFRISVTTVEGDIKLWPLRLLSYHLFRVSGFGFRVSGFGFSVRVEGLGSRVWV